MINSPAEPCRARSATSLLQTLAALTRAPCSENMPRSKGATLETCPSGQLLEIDGTDRRATHVGGGARRSEAATPPVLEPYRLGDRGVEQRARCPGVVDQGR